MKLGSHLGLKLASLSVSVGLILSGCTTTEDSATAQATEDGMPSELGAEEGDTLMPGEEAPAKVKAKPKKKKKMKKRRMKKKRKAAPAAGE